MKDIVDFFFIASIIENVYHFNITEDIRTLERVKDCPRMREVFNIVSSFMWQQFAVKAKLSKGPSPPAIGINGTEDSFLPTIDKCDRMDDSMSKLDPYCMRKDSYMKNVTTACQNITNRDIDTNNVIIRDIITQQRCLERTSNYHPEILKSCWKDIVSTGYPTKDVELLQFFCEHTYPNALRRMVDSCYFERMRSNFVYWSLQSQNWTQVEAVESKYPCAVSIFIDSEKNMLSQYRKRYIPIQVSWQKSQVCHHRKEDMIKRVFLDATCHYRQSTPRGRTLLKICWKMVAKMEMPKTKEEWLSLLCRESMMNLPRIQEQVSSCFKHGLIFLYRSGMYEDGRYEKCLPSFPLVEPSDNEKGDEDDRK